MLNGDVIVSGSDNASVRMWSVSSGKHHRTLHGNTAEIFDIAFDGENMVTGGVDASVRIWNAENG